MLDKTLTDFKIYYQTTLIKTVCYWCKGRQINGTEQRARNRPTYGQQTMDNWHVWTCEKVSSVIK